jgi:hypothetical protein
VNNNIFGKLGELTDGEYSVMVLEAIILKLAKSFKSNFVYLPASISSNALLLTGTVIIPL